jgi:ABC-2 type transport system ATP-binding protein
MVSGPQIVVETKNLTKIYRDFWGRQKVRALKALDLQIQKGEIFGLLGPNGSGKTTTIKLLLGLLFPTSGDISILGKTASDVGKNEKIGYLPEESYLYRFLNAEETLDFYGRLFKMSGPVRRQRVSQLINMVGLESAKKRQLREYSKGMTRRIGLAQALINDPDLILLDEPTSGLDPIGTKNMKDLILELREQGKTIIMFFVPMGSSPLVGSSSKIRSGSLINACAKPIRRVIPLEYSRNCRFLADSSPTILMSCETRCRRTGPDILNSRP